jgi:hypothetical protein
VIAGMLVHRDISPLIADRVHHDGPCPSISPRSVRTRALISPRIGLTCSMVSPAGSEVPAQVALPQEDRPATISFHDAGEHATRHRSFTAPPWRDLIHRLRPGGPRPA